MRRRNWLYFTFTLCCALFLAATFRSLSGVNVRSPLARRELSDEGLASTGDVCVASSRPCSYADKVNFRVIVITQKRAKSLLKLLESVDTLVLDGDSASLEIWIDRFQDTNEVHQGTVQVAKGFTWKSGKTRVHIHPHNVGIYGQWIDTWRPNEECDLANEELSLILEDDLSVSPYAYRWIKAVHKAYGERTDFAGVTIQSDHVRVLANIGFNKPLVGPKSDQVFMYPLIGSWGYSPSPTRWREFQDWYYTHNNKVRPEFKPYVAGLRNTDWYKEFEAAGKAHLMWTMWHMYFTNAEQLYSVYSNLRAFRGETDSCVGLNRNVMGLHGHNNDGRTPCRLLTTWHDNFTDFRKTITKLNSQGKVLTTQSRAGKLPLPVVADDQELIKLSLKSSVVQSEILAKENNQ